MKMVYTKPERDWQKHHIICSTISKDLGYKMRDWLKENCVESGWTYGYMLDRWTFHFDNKSDMIAFKIVWG